MVVVVVVKPDGQMSTCEVTITVVIMRTFDAEAPSCADDGAGVIAALDVAGWLEPAVADEPTLQLPAALEKVGVPEAGAVAGARLPVAEALEMPFELGTEVLDAAAFELITRLDEAPLLGTVPLELAVAVEEAAPAAAPELFAMLEETAQLELTTDLENTGLLETSALEETKPHELGETMEGATSDAASEVTVSDIAIKTQSTIPQNCLDCIRQCGFCLSDIKKVSWMCQVSRIHCTICHDCWKEDGFFNVGMFSS